jgi:hypothetical protein
VTWLVLSGVARRALSDGHDVGRQNCLLLRISFAWVLLLSFWVKAEIVREESVECVCYRNGLITVPVVSGCGRKGLWD